MEIPGQIGITFESGKIEEGIETQTHRAMKNILSQLTKVGWGFSLIKVRIFLVNMSDYTAMNDVYATYFGDEYPTRFALAVSELPAGGLVEIECKAVGDSYES